MEQSKKFIIPEIGNKVSIFHMYGEGSYSTIGNVLDRNGERVLIEETHIEEFVWNEETKKGHFIPVLITNQLHWAGSLVNWYEPKKEEHFNYNMFCICGSTTGVDIRIEADNVLEPKEA